MQGFLSNGKRFIATPVVDQVFGLCGETDPKNCGFITASPVVMILLYEEGWVVATDNNESFVIKVERGLPQ